MKTILLFFYLVAFLSSFGQFSNDSFNAKRLDINRKAMYVLGGWAAGNIIWGVAGTATSSGSDKSFHQMNLGWGVVNGVLAGVSLLQFKKAKTSGLDFARTVRDQQKIEKLFLINGGLDLAYLGAGAWMLEKSKTQTSKPEQWKGFGNSLHLQGSFLLVFDAINYAVHNRHGKILAREREKMDLSAGPGGLSLAIQL
jgi:hypothetical protein